VKFDQVIVSQNSFSFQKIILDLEAIKAFTSSRKIEKRFLTKLNDSYRKPFLQIIVEIRRKLVGGMLQSKDND
jgi:hypothetical protein